MPVTVGSPRIPLDRFAATITTDRPLPEDPTRAPGSTEQRIAAHIAELVDDGDTVQLGVGSLGAAVLDALAEHEDLGFHTGMVTDGLLRLLDKGVATGSRKEIDPGLIVAGTALGSAELYHRVAELPASFLPTSYTHSPQVLSQLRSLVSVNFAVEVDLSGQVGAEVSRGVYVGAVGGQVDFARAAALTGKRSVFALRATSGGQSTIKTSLDGGVVTTRDRTSTPSSPNTASRTCAAAASASGPNGWPRSPPRSFATSSTGKDPPVNCTSRETIVEIREVGPRDGFQNEPETIATADKIRLINRLARTGLKRIEVASFVRPDVIPQLSDGVEVLRGI